MNEEVQLTDIDKLLEAEDPDFTKSLDDVRSVENAADVVIESNAIVALDDQFEEKPETALQKLKFRIKNGISTFRLRLKARLIFLWKDTLIFLKTRPKEFALYAFVVLKLLLKKALVPLVAFKQATRSQKILMLALVAMMVASVTVLLANLRGVWLPAISEPVLQSFAQVAESIETFDPKDGFESFYVAFPQERHEYMFPKMKVNLKRTAQNPNPMGAFEVIVQVDSKDTAVELRDREVELFDRLQRVFEEESFNDLETEFGKTRLKGKIKRELNEKLTQGWIKDVNYRTFILKP